MDKIQNKVDSGEEESADNDETKAMEDMGGV